VKCELIDMPDLDTLANWDSDDEPPVITLPPLVSATDLYKGEVVPLRPLIKGLLWDGLTMLIARPKAGKSWFTLQCAVRVAGGREVDGMTMLDHGPVLYGAFEEPQARTMARLRKLTPEGAWTENLHFLYDLLPLMAGGAEQLAAFIRKIKPRLVVLDTFTALVKTGSKGGSDVFRSQYAEVSCLRKLAEELHTAIIVVHHTRKGISESAIEAVAGTGGIAAAVDTLWYLIRKAEGDGTLEVIGRETEEHTLAMQFDNEPLGWRILGDEDAQTLNAERRQVIDLLREDGALSPAQISVELGKTRAAVRMLLKRMKDDDQITKPALSMARVVCFSQPISVMISSSVVPPSRLSISITRLVLLSARGAFTTSSPVGAFGLRVAFLVGSAATGASSGTCSLTLGSGSGAGSSAGVSSATGSTADSGSSCGSAMGSLATSAPRL
jgi:hypothetical protein